MPSLCTKEGLADCIEKLALFFAFTKLQEDHHPHLQNEIESLVRQLTCHVFGDIDIISEDKWIQSAYKQGNALSSCVCPVFRCVGDFLKCHSAAALAKTTEEHDHHILLKRAAHSRYQQFVQEEVTKRQRKTRWKCSNWANKLISSRA